MHEHGLELQGALEWLGAFMETKTTRFLSIMKDLPSWDTEDNKKLKVYIDGLGNWVRGNECWSLESERYYGREGSTVDKLRVIKLHSRQECGLILGKRSRTGVFRGRLSNSKFAVILLVIFLLIPTIHLGLRYLKWLSFVSLWYLYIKFWFCLVIDSVEYYYSLFLRSATDTTDTTTWGCRNSMN